MKKVWNILEEKGIDGRIHFCMGSLRGLVNSFTIGHHHHHRHHYHHHRHHRTFDIQCQYQNALLTKKLLFHSHLYTFQYVLYCMYAFITNNLLVIFSKNIHKNFIELLSISCFTLNLFSAKEISVFLVFFFFTFHTQNCVVLATRWQNSICK